MRTDRLPSREASVMRETGQWTRGRLAKTEAGASVAARRTRDAQGRGIKGRHDWCSGIQGCGWKVLASVYKEWRDAFAVSRVESELRNGKGRSAEPKGRLRQTPSYR